jgi:hypothetical protein
MISMAETIDEILGKENLVRKVRIEVSFSGWTATDDCDYHVLCAQFGSRYTLCESEPLTLRVPSRCLFHESSFNG